MKKILSVVITGLFAVTLFAFPVPSSAQDQSGPMFQSDEPSVPAQQPKKSSKKKTTKSKSKKKSSKSKPKKKSSKKSSSKKSSM